MYTFEFDYEDGSNFKCYGISLVKYCSGGNTKVVNANEFSSHMFPVSHDLNLYSETQQFCVSSKNLKSITITKQK